MKLFKYEGYQITIEPEALLLKPFKVIWDRDRSKNKNKALTELGYIYFFADPRSDYQYIIDESDRINAIKEGEGLPNDWKPDVKIKEAIEFYKQFKSTSALLLDTTRSLVDKLMKQMETLDLDERDEKGKPVFPLNLVTSTIDKVPALIMKLNDAEKIIASETRDDSKMRGQGEKSIFEDNLNI